MDHINLLRRLGLSKTEAELYLASLELGPASAMQLGQTLGFTRQLMYNLLPDLVEQGYMKQILVGKRSFYQAVDPQVLEDKAQELASELHTALPALKSRQTENKSVPTVTIYDSPVAMREWYRTFMKVAKRDEEKLIYSTESGWYGLDPDFYQAYTAFQDKHHVRNRIIAPDTSTAREASSRFLATPVHRERNSYRFAPEGWKGENSKWIWRDQIIFLTIRGKSTNMVVMESAEMAAIERFAFERVWGSLGEERKG